MLTILSHVKWTLGSITNGFNLLYNNTSTGLAKRAIDLAVKAWFDMPVPLGFVATNFIDNADIVFREVADYVTGDAPGITPVSCSGGLIQRPVTVWLYDRYKDRSGACCYYLNTWPEDKLIGLAAHEFGHALGLDHSENRSL